MSKARKKRDNQVYIKDIEEWTAAVAKPILLVAEIFAPHFGPCENMFPFIDELTTNLDNQGQADEVHWAIVNVSKLEDEKTAANAEDALKKQETKVGEKPKEEGVGGADGDSAGPGSAAKEPQEPDNEHEISEQLDMTIPYLEKYAGFNHPTPHYLFFRNGVVIDELRGANPPKLEQLVRKWIAIKDISSSVTTSPPADTVLTEIAPWCFN
ncbi:hypothetical protein BVRB_023830 [Beta vulgaris subsp. vulgaris]|uniref:Thioredoxin domain-containing protein n=1 Tax=Beta vulgaris subsp. vulgaris TaxID=3555 RepID=A0A0J8B2X0_BETVV|nr:hypothetical protein BVRB_023830 [Beta vulgaris subsp. vulgaris]